MTNEPRYSGARPAEVGPHDVNDDQNDPKAKGRRPEDAYKNEIGGQVAGLGTGGQAGKAGQDEKKP